MLLLGPRNTVNVQQAQLADVVLPLLNTSVQIATKCETFPFS